MIDDGTVPYPDSSNGSGGSAKSRGWLLILFIVTIGIIVGLYFFKETILDILPGNFSRNDDPQGALYLSLSPLNGDRTGIYRFSFEEKFLDKLFTSKNLVHINASFPSGTNEKMIVSSNLAIDGNYEGNDGTVYQIYQADKFSGALDQLTFADSPYFKRQPTFSALLDGVFYSAHVDKEPSPDEFMDLANWNVYFAGKDKKEVLFGNGAHPQLSPDGKYLLVLRSDGLYTIDVKTKEATQVWDLESGVAIANMQLDISKDGTKIVWSNMGQGKVYIFQVYSWAPFSMRKMVDLDAYGFWPVFSPDGKYLAFEEVDNKEVPDNQRLVVFNLETFAKEIELDLTPYAQTSLFLDDWILN